jgi:hypothetical protein
MRTENIMQSNKKIASSCPRLGYPKRALIRGSAFWRLRAHLAFESCFDNTESSVFHPDLFVVHCLADSLLAAEITLMCSSTSRVLD